MKRYARYEMCPECFGTYSHDENCSRIESDPKPFTMREQLRNQKVLDPIVPKPGSGSESEALSR